MPNFRGSRINEYKQLENHKHVFIESVCKRGVFLLGNFILVPFGVMVKWCFSKRCRHFDAANGGRRYILRQCS